MIAYDPVHLLRLIMAALLVGAALGGLAFYLFVAATDGLSDKEVTAPAGPQPTTSHGRPLTSNHTETREGDHDA